MVASRDSKTNYRIKSTDGLSTRINSVLALLYVYLEYFVCLRCIRFRHISRMELINYYGAVRALCAYHAGSEKLVRVYSFNAFTTGRDRGAYVSLSGLPTYVTYG